MDRCVTVLVPATARFTFDAVLLVQQRALARQVAPLIEMNAR